MHESLTPSVMRDELKRGLSQLPGRTIAHVIVAEGNAPPSQLFLVFTDGTYYEFYATAGIDGTATVDRGDVAEIHRFTKGPQRVIFEI